MTLPERRHGLPVRRPGGTPAKRSPGRIEYVEAERIGFEHVPQVLVEEMWARGLLAGEVWAAGGDEGVAKRRPDGSHFQHIEGWWSSQWRYVQLDARRELVLGSDGRLRPGGPWQASGTIWNFSAPFVPERSVWRYQPESANPSGRRPARHVAVDPLDTLPGSVTAPVMGGSSCAWRERGEGWASESIVASKVRDGRVLLLRANREATSMRRLAMADWVVETVDTPVASAVPYSIGQRGSTSSATPASARPRGQEETAPPRPHERTFDQHHRRVCVRCGTKTRWRDAEGRALCPGCDPDQPDPRSMQG
jgi:hypothetical protein